MGQELTVSGSGHIVVQIEGDDNQVNLKGLAHLTLTRYLNRRQVESDADILSPYSLSIELVGRQTELASLRAWLASPKPIAVRVLTGRAGAGKTRLALELCEALVAEGWQAGFVTERELQRFLAAQNLSTWGWQRSCMVVVDYAAAHAQALYGWLAELSDHAGFADRPLRLLLLERAAEAGSGWWQTAFGRGDSTDRAIRRLLDPAEPVSLPGLAAPDERRAIFAAALAKGRSDLEPPALGTEPQFDNQLARLSWGGEPLFLMMAGLLAARHGLRQVLALSRTDLAFDLAERELARIARLAGGNPSLAALLTHMAAYVTLVRGLAGDPLRAAIEAERAALRRADAGDAASLAEALCTALPGARDEAAPILPDMIGEAAMLLAFRPCDVAGTLRHAYAGQPEQTVAAVIRTAQDFAGQAWQGQPNLAPLEWLDTLIAHDAIDVDQLALIARQLIDGMRASGRSLALTDHARRVLEPIVADCRRRIEAGDAKAPEALAWHQHDLSIVLSNLGRREEALGAAEEAVALRRELAAARPDAFVPALALSLNNLGIRLSELGRREEALGAAEEAAGLYRELAAARSDAFAHQLALSLSVLADRLEELGRAEEAAQRDLEAVQAIAPYFLRHPMPYAGQMIPIARDWMRRCEQLGQAPDTALLVPIVAALAALAADGAAEG